MSPSAQARVPLPGAEINQNAIINHALESIATAIPAVDLICACTLRSDESELIASYASDPGLDQDYTQLVAIFLDLVRDDPASPEARIVEGAPLADTPFESGLFFPLFLAEHLIGFLSLLARSPGAFTSAEAERVAMQASIVRVALENFQLYEVAAHNMVMAQSVMHTARSIGEDSDPQHLVDVLKDMLFDTHVSLAAVLHYGPDDEDRPHGPFEYLQIKGSWTRQRGGGIALDQRIYLDRYASLQQRLDRHETVVINDVNTTEIYFDPLVRSLLRAEKTVALAIVPLTAARRKLGVMLVGTDMPHEFSPAELDTYQTVSDVVAISTVADVLRQQHDRVQGGRAALLESVTDGVLMVLPEANSTRVLTVNKRFNELFIPKDTEVQGMVLGDLLRTMQLPEDIRAGLARQWDSISVSDPAYIENEFRFVSAEGQSLDIHWYSAPVYQDQRVLGRIYIFNDVTAERTAKRMHSQFLSRVSHELRTPLTSLQGFAQMILETEGDNLPPLAREYTEIIYNSGQHLRVLFNDLIVLTQADAGKLKLMLSPAHLPDIILDAVVALEPQYRAREQSMVLALDDDLPPVYIDVDRITQVMLNLVNNAIKYSPPNSRISVSTHYIGSATDLPASAPGSILLPCVMVSVIDEGAGIAAADIEEMFMPFFRSEGAKAKKIEGTGLGLAITRSIIELHRGQIWIEAASAELPGGRFFFTLPIHQG